jgi:outer membrane protein assembly factor BamB
MGMLFYLYAIPVVSLAFVVWAAATRSQPDGLRRATMVATILLACGAWALVRTGGFTADLDSDFAWRWAKTPEERLLAQGVDETPVLRSAPTAEEAAVTQEVDGSTATRSAPDPDQASEEEPTEQAGREPAELSSAPAVVETFAAWPGFRGPGRDGRVAGVRIATDWAASPPVEVWRRPIGPGWSSFAVRGDRLYTQEQRGDDEVVACYDATTGDPVWRHGDAARFWESNAGAGPRGTPTLSGGRVYTFGATGIVNSLDAADGVLAWSRNAAADTGTEVPTWGFSSSPLVVGDVVVVAAAGSLAAYDASSGDPRWSRPAGAAGESYSSPHLATIEGVEQVLLLGASGVSSVLPADGTLLWEHPWKGFPIVQPAVTRDGDVLISVTDHSGTRRLAVAHGAAGWTAEERWTSQGLKPYFNDFVVHEGHAFGFDGGILAAIDLGDGERVWKGGRYGHGQLVLLPDQDMLLVLSEKGELVLVGATPEEFTELARFPAIEGKTWNHPVLVGDLLLVRNGQEMAAFRLPLASS